MITKEEAAEALNGSEYGEEGSTALFADMKASGLVAVFGASDDLIEFRGAIYDEVGAYDGGTAYVTRKGLFEQTCDNEDCPHEGVRRDSATKIDALWCPGDPGDVSWAYRTAIPHVTFSVMEEGETYCRGIVFALSDVPV